VGVVAQQAGAEPHEPGTVPVDERAEGQLVAGPEPGEERVVILGVEGCPHGLHFGPEPLCPFGSGQFPANQSAARRPEIFLAATPPGTARKHPRRSVPSSADAPTPQLAGGTPPRISPSQTRSSDVPHPLCPSPPAARRR